jgi:thiamine phosphate synthase YjbQ (UPF0047 family)
VVVQANGFLAVARDIESALERIVDESWPWTHTEEETTETHRRTCWLR